MLKLKKVLRVFGLIFISLYMFTSCTDESSPLADDTADSPEAAMKQMIDEDEAYLSFEPAYNEEDALSILPKTDATIYPVRVGQRMILTDIEKNIEVTGDSAFGTVTKYFAGRLFIAASYDEFEPGDSNVVDTLLTKDFETKVTRNFKFVKVANTDNPRRDWKITAISLPEGGTITNGTLSNNIIIDKLTITLENGTELVIEDPTNYFLSRGVTDDARPLIPVIGRLENALLTVELRSSYEDDDFVTLTFGAKRVGYAISKKRFELLSSDFDGVYYNKVYQAEYTTHRFPGFFHAIINAIPKQVVHDDATPVEEHTWGFPYRIN